MGFFRDLGVHRDLGFGGFRGFESICAQGFNGLGVWGSSAFSVMCGRRCQIGLRASRENRHLSSFLLGGGGGGWFKVGGGVGGFRSVFPCFGYLEGGWGVSVVSKFMIFRALSALEELELSAS